MKAEDSKLSKHIKRSSPGDFVCDFHSELEGSNILDVKFQWINEVNVSCSL